jgi:hypothetical protein
MARPIPCATTDRTKAKSLPSSAIRGSTPARSSASSTTWRVEEPRWKAIRASPVSSLSATGSVGPWRRARAWRADIATASSSWDNSSRSMPLGATASSAKVTSRLPSASISSMRPAVPSRSPISMFG